MKTSERGKDWSAPLLIPIDGNFPPIIVCSCKVYLLYPLKMQLYEREWGSTKHHVTLLFPPGHNIRIL